MLARLATPEDFGEYAAGTLLVNIGLLFTESGMLAALVHREDQIDEAASTATVALVASGVFFSLVALAASPLVGLIFHSSRIGDIAAASSALLLCRALVIVPQALLQRRFSFLRRMISEPASVIAFGVVAVIACSEGMGPWGLVLGYYASAIADAVLSWGLVRWRPRLHQVSWKLWRELAAYGRYVLAAHAVMLGGQQLPILLIGRFSGSGPLGQYRYAERLSVTPLALVIQAGSYVLFPAFARIKGERERFRAAMLRSLRLMCALSFPLVLLMVPLGVPAAMLLFGDIWKDAGYATMALAGAAVGETLISFASEVLKADGHPEILTRVHIVLFGCSAVAMLALLPIGLIGICAGISIGALAASVYALHRVRALNSITTAELVHECVPPLIAGLTMIAVMVPLEFLVVEAQTRGTFVGLVLVACEAIAGLLVYTSVMWAMSRSTIREMRDLAMRMLPARHAS